MISHMNKPSLMNTLNMPGEGQVKPVAPIFLSISAGYRVFPEYIRHWKFESSQEPYGVDVLGRVPVLVS